QLAYTNQSLDGSNVILVVVNLDPQWTQAGWAELPLEEMGLPEGSPFLAHDLLSGARYTWQGAWNFVELNPAVMPVHIMRLEVLEEGPRNALTSNPGTDGSALVHGRHHLRAPRPRLRRQRWRRYGRLRRADGKARLPAGARHHGDLGAPVLPVPLARRRLRHRRLHGCAPRLRQHVGLPTLPQGSAPARPACDHRARHQPHL